jgi:cell division protein FtsQ
MTQFIFARSDFFLIKEIAVVGAKYIPVEQIVEHSNIVKQNIWNVIFDVGNTGSSTVISRLKTIPWIRNISLQYELPDRIILNVIERKPIAIIKTGDKSFYIDEEGIIVSTVDMLEKWNFPLIRGLDESKNFLGKKLELSNLSNLLICLKSYDAALVDDFPEVEINKEGDIILYSKNNIKFNLGSNKKDLVGKLSLLPSILQSVTSRNLHIDFVDMRYKRFVLKLQEPPKKTADASVHINTQIKRN